MWKLSSPTETEIMSGFPNTRGSIGLEVCHWKTSNAAGCSPRFIFPKYTWFSGGREEGDRKCCIFFLFIIVGTSFVTRWHIEMEFFFQSYDFHSLFWPWKKIFKLFKTISKNLLHLALKACLIGQVPWDTTLKAPDKCNVSSIIKYKFKEHWNIHVRSLSRLSISRTM